MQVTFINSHIFGGHDLKVVVVDESIPSLLLVTRCSTQKRVVFVLILIVLLLYFSCSSIVICIYDSKSQYNGKIHPVYAEEEEHLRQEEGKIPKMYARLKVLPLVDLSQAIPFRLNSNLKEISYLSSRLERMFSARLWWMIDISRKKKGRQ